MQHRNLLIEHTGAYREKKEREKLGLAHSGTRQLQRVKIVIVA